MAAVAISGCSAAFVKHGHSPPLREPAGCFGHSRGREEHPSPRFSFSSDPHWWQAWSRLDWPSEGSKSAPESFGWAERSEALGESLLELGRAQWGPSGLMVRLLPAALTLVISDGVAPELIG